MIDLKLYLWTYKSNLLRCFRVCRDERFNERTQNINHDKPASTATKLNFQSFQTWGGGRNFEIINQQRKYYKNVRRIEDIEIPAYLIFIHKFIRIFNHFWKEWGFSHIWIKFRLNSWNDFRSLSKNISIPFFFPL